MLKKKPYHMVVTGGGGVVVDTISTTTAVVDGEDEEDESITAAEASVPPPPPRALPTATPPAATTTSILPAEVVIADNMAEFVHQHPSRPPPPPPRPHSSSTSARIYSLLYPPAAAALAAQHHHAPTTVTAVSQDDDDDDDKEDNNKLNNKNGDDCMPQSSSPINTAASSKNGTNIMFHTTRPSSSTNHDKLEINVKKDDDMTMMMNQQQRQEQQPEQQDKNDERFVENFWTTYDDIIFLSLFSQLGIIFRLASSVWISHFGTVYSTQSPLFVNLPLNCLSCFLMGLLCPGERLMEVIMTRFTPPHLQQQVLLRGSYLPQEQHQHNNKNKIDDNESVQLLSDEEEEVDGLQRQQQPAIDPEASDDFYNMDDSNDDNDDADGVMVVHRPKRTTLSIANPISRNRRKTRQRRHHHHRHQQREKRSRYLSSLEQYEQDPKRYYANGWLPRVHLNDELRDVQLLALERRIRQSKCLFLFPGTKEDIDVLESYFDDGFQKNNHHHQVSSSSSNSRRQVLSDSDTRMMSELDEPVTVENMPFDLELHEHSDSSHHHQHQRVLVEITRRTVVPRVDVDPSNYNNNTSRYTSPTSATNFQQRQSSSSSLPSSPVHGGIDPFSTTSTSVSPNPSHVPSNSIVAEAAGSGSYHPPTFTDRMKINMEENYLRLQRVNLADGWDRGTTAEAMSDDLLLGLRAGFCGALSSFSSWNSSMITLMRNGQMSMALVGYMIGLELPIIAYRFGQHVAVYIFVWRCRKETKADDRRGGYGIRINTNDCSDREPEPEIITAASAVVSDIPMEQQKEDTTPSMRVIATTLFVISLVTQCTSMSFYQDPANQQLALSLLFSPFGGIARWRLSQYNNWRPNFPIGTFTANIVACALSGSLGSLLAGNPGPRERIVLVSFIAGFGGTLSSLAAFVVEILAGVDPILFRYDGIIYAALSMLAAIATGFIFSASVDWADASWDTTTTHSNSSSNISNSHSINMTGVRG